MKTIEEKIFPNVSFQISLHEEHIDYHKSFSFEETGADCTEHIEWITRELNDLNLWAWCCIEVKAYYRGIGVSDFLGGCSYRNEEDFKNDGYEEMKTNCLHEIVKIVEQINEDLK